MFERAGDFFRIFESPDVLAARKSRFSVPVEKRLGLFVWERLDRGARRIGADREVRRSLGGVARFDRQNSQRIERADILQLEICRILADFKVRKTPPQLDERVGDRRAVLGRRQSGGFEQRAYRDDAVKRAIGRACVLQRLVRNSR
jgi:hypothetical protein